MPRLFVFCCILESFAFQDLRIRGDITRPEFLERAVNTSQNQEKYLKITQEAISEQVRDSRMPAVEEEGRGIKNTLVSPLLKRKTGGVIEMWITDESYTSPVKEAKVLESLDLADDLNPDEEKVEKTEEEKEGEVDLSFSNTSDLLQSSADPDVEIEEVELGDEGVGGAREESCDKFPSSKVGLSSDSGGHRFSKTSEEKDEKEEGQLVFNDMKAKDNDAHESKAKTEEGVDDQKFERTEDEEEASEKSTNSNHNEQKDKHGEISVKENAKTNKGNYVEVINLGQESKEYGKDCKVLVEARKVPVEVVELDSEEEEEEMEEEEAVHRSAGGGTTIR